MNKAILENTTKNNNTAQEELAALQEETKNLSTEEKQFVEQVVKRTIKEYRPAFERLAQE